MVSGLIAFSALQWLLIILFGAWRLLLSSLRLSLDGVPGNISMKDIISSAMKTAGVKGIHHIHIWAISTTENALTAHIVLLPKLPAKMNRKSKMT